MSASLAALPAARGISSVGRTGAPGERCPSTCESGRLPCERDA
jgi:hypothetical protein